MSLAMLRRRAVLVLLLLGLAAPCGAPAQEKQPAEANRWEAAIRQFEEQDAQHPPPPGGVVFVGSSSIRLWDLQASFPDLAAVNRGFGGSQLGDAAEFAERIVVPHQPRVVVVYAGDNDLAAGKTPEEVVAAYRRLVEKIHARLPQTRIVYIGIKPSLRRWALVDRVRAANRAIAQIAAADARLAFVDIDAPMIGADGLPRKELFVADGLHLSPQGYRLWAERLRPLLTTD